MNKETQIIFEKYQQIALEASNKFQGNAYSLLASIGITPNKKYNFYSLVKKWYEDNTNIPINEIDAMLKAKEVAARKDKNPNYVRLGKFNTDTYLMGPEQWNPNLGDILGYLDQNNNLYINPIMQWNGYGDLITTLIHETLHGVQKKNMVWGTTRRDLYNPGRKVDIQDGDFNIQQDTLRYITQPMEIDPVLAQVNRIIAKAKNKMISPNSLDAEMELRWVLDPKNDRFIPNEFKNDVYALQDIVSGKFKAQPNTPQEQNRIIKSWAQRMSLLASNSVPQNTRVA